MDATTAGGWRSGASIDPEVCHGKPCIKGRRSMVSSILDRVQRGESTEAILKQHPTLAAGAIQAAIGYGVWLAREEEARSRPPETGG